LAAGVHKLTCAVSAQHSIEIYFFICVLFDDAVIIADYIYLNDVMTDEYCILKGGEGTDRGLILGTIPLYFPRETEEHRENVRIVEVSAEIRTGYLPNTIEECCRMCHIARWKTCTSLFSLRTEGREM
jgi:hypothetical protein